MTKPYLLDLKTAIQRVPFVLKRKGFLSDLNLLAETVRKEFKKIAEDQDNNREEAQKNREQSLRLDFMRGKTSTGKTLPGKICELIRAVQIHELIIKLDTGGIRYVGVDFPDKELKVAVKFALRELAMNGKRLNAKEENLSSIRKSAEKHRGYQQGIEVKARAALYRVSTFEAGLTLFYRIDAGRVPLSVVNFGGKIDD